MRNPDFSNAKIDELCWHITFGWVRIHSVAIASYNEDRRICVCISDYDRYGNFSDSVKLFFNSKGMWSNSNSRPQKYPALFNSFEQCQEYWSKRKKPAVPKFLKEEID